MGPNSAADLNLDSELLIDLTGERSFVRLPGLDLAARELPLAVQVGAGALRQQNQAVALDHGAHDVLHGFIFPVVADEPASGIQLSPRPLEHLARVPTGEFCFRLEFAAHRRRQLPTVKIEYPAFEPARTHGLLGHYNLSGRRQREDAAVQQFVVQTAERQAVRFVIRPTGLVPFNVCCFQTDKDGPQAYV